MTRSKILVAAIVGGCLLVVALPVFCWVIVETRFLYEVFLAAALIGITFLLGAFLTVPGVNRRFEKLGAFVQREKRTIFAGLALLLLVVVFGVFFLEQDAGFVKAHRTELFWLVVFPGIMASPFLIGQFWYHLRGNGRA